MGVIPNCPLSMPFPDQISPRVVDSSLAHSNTTPLLSTNQYAEVINQLPPIAETDDYDYSEDSSAPDFESILNDPPEPDTTCRASVITKPENNIYYASSNSSAADLSSVSSRVSCRICGKTYYPRALKNHMNTQHSKEQRSHHDTSLTVSGDISVNNFLHGVCVAGHHGVFLIRNTF